MTQQARFRMRSAALTLLVLQLVAILWALYSSPSPAAWMIVRAAALLGYVALFWAIVSSAYVREVRQILGRPFLRVHHVLTVAAWVCILAHPLVLAWQLRDPRVFVPIVSDLRSFLATGGRVALYLVAAGTLAAVLRKRLALGWRWIHRLNLVGFLMAFAHAWLLGEDLRRVALRVLWLAMAIIVLVVGAHKVIGGERR